MYVCQANLKRFLFVFLATVVRIICIFICIFINQSSKNCVVLDDVVHLELDVVAEQVEEVVEVGAAALV